MDVAQLTRPWRSVRLWGRMVKFPHSLFALPFAFAGAALAAAQSGISGRQVLWIAVAMVGARNAAMGFNRLADQRFDADNPRTSSRELPSGALGRGAVWAFTVGLSALFVFAATRLSTLCGLLSPVALAIVFGYSFSKRFTWASHLWLGLALAVAPVGGWLAVAGRFDAVAWWLAAAVLFWVAGFDVIYACQDLDFDRGAGLHSIPQRFGPRGALALARVFHALAVAAMIAVGLAAGLHPVYWIGMALIVLLLAWEHRLVHAEDLSRVGTAFFNMNAVISAAYLLTVLAAIGVGRPA